MTGKKTLKPKRKCGLCGKTKKLTKTECCGQWICDDEDEYVMFSYARNSCYRNHPRYTLCALHRAEKHEGDEVLRGNQLPPVERKYVWLLLNLSRMNEKLQGFQHLIKTVRCERADLLRQIALIHSSQK